MRLYEINLSEDDAVDKVMKDFDTSKNNEIEFSEFVAGLSKWLLEAKGSKIDAHLAGPDTLKYIHDYYEVYLCHNSHKVESVEYTLRLFG